MDGVPDQGVATRVLVEDSEWGRAAERALSEWRASLFGRMAMQYKELERNKSESGTKTIERRAAGGLAWGGHTAVHLVCVTLHFPAASLQGGALPAVAL